MNNYYNIVPIVLVLTLVFPVLSSGSPKAAPPSQVRPTLCEPSEQIAYSCSVGAKIASLCVSGASNQVVQYRFGKKDKIELRYPDQIKNSASMFKYSSAPYAGGGEEHISFHNEKYDYIIYSKDTGGFPPQIDDGIIILLGGKSISHLKCRGPAVVAAPGRFMSHEPFKKVPGIP